MNTVNIYVGATFLVPIPGVPKHLCVVIHGPFIPFGFSTQYIVYVNITTRKNKNVGDQTCILKNGDHEFISHDSIVNYPLTQCLPLSTCLINFGSGRYKQKEPMRAEVLQRIRDGLIASEHTPRKIKKIFRENSGEAVG